MQLEHPPLYSETSTIFRQEIKAPSWIEALIGTRGPIRVTGPGACEPLIGPGRPGVRGAFWVFEGRWATSCSSWPGLAWVEPGAPFLGCDPHEFSGFLGLALAKLGKIQKSGSWALGFDLQFGED